MSYSDMNKRYKDDMIKNYVNLVENIDTSLILPHLANCLHESDLEELRKKLELNSRQHVNQILLEKLVTREYWWKSLIRGLVAIKSENLLKDLGWQIDEIETVADVSHESQRVKTTFKEEPTTSKPVVTGLDNNGRSPLCVIQDVTDQKFKAYKNQSKLAKGASLQTNMKVVPNDLNVGVQDTLVVTDTKNLNEFSEAKVDQRKTIDSHAVQGIEPSKDEGKLTIEPNVRKHLPLKPEAINHGNIAQPVEKVEVTLKEVEPFQQSPPCLKGPSNIPRFHTESSLCNSYKPPEQIISDQILRDNNPPVGAQSDVQEYSFSEIIPKATDDRYNIVPGINSQEPGSISTDEIPSLDGNIFDDDNSISSTATVDPQGHSADGGMKGEICIASNKTNVTTDPRSETKYSMVSPYVTTLHGSYTDSESVDSQDIRSGPSEQQLLQQQVLCHGNMSNPETATNSESIDSSTGAPSDIQQTRACQSSDGTRDQSPCPSPALSDLDFTVPPVVNSDPDQSLDSLQPQPNFTIPSQESSVMDSHIFYPPSLSEQRTEQSASLSGVFPPEGSSQLDIPVLSIFQESSPAASRPLSQEVPLVSPTERLEDQIDFNSSGDRTENMQDLMRHVDDPILELNGQQAQNRESNLPSLTEHVILTAAQAIYSLTR